MLERGPPVGPGRHLDHAGEPRPGTAVKLPEDPQPAALNPLVGKLLPANLHPQLLETGEAADTSLPVWRRGVIDGGQPNRAIQPLGVRNVRPEPLGWVPQFPPEVVGQDLPGVGGGNLRMADQAGGFAPQQPFEFIKQLGGVAEPLVGILPQAFVDNAIDRLAQRRDERPQMGRRFGHVLVNQPGDIPRFKRGAARQHVEQGGPQGIDVGPHIDPPRPRALLGSEVQGRPHQGARLGHRQRFALDHLSGQAKVGELHPRKLGYRPVGVGIADQDVARLQIAVHHPLPVRLQQRAGHIGPHRHRLALGQPTPLFQHAPQVAAIHKLHREVMQVPLAIHLQHIRNVRIAHLGQQPDLAMEPPGHQLVPGSIRSQHLQGHDPTIHRIFRLPHRAHASLAQLQQQPITPQRGPPLQRVARGAARRPLRSPLCHRGRIEFKIHVVVPHVDGIADECRAAAPGHAPGSVTFSPLVLPVFVDPSAAPLGTSTRSPAAR